MLYSTLQSGFICKAALSNSVCVWLNLTFGKLLSNLSPFLWRRWEIAGRAANSLTSQVAPSEPPYSLTEWELLLLLKAGRWGWGGWQLWHGIEKVEEEPGVWMVGRYKDLSPRSASHLSCITFFPFLIKHVMPALRGWKQNYVSARGELAMTMYLTDVEATCAPMKAPAPSVLMTSQPTD